MQLYISGWKSIPELDPDIAYRNYLENALATDDRCEFDLAKMEFVARLRRDPVLEKALEVARNSSD